MSAPTPLRRRVPSEAEGCRLDVFLARQPEVGSRALAKALVQQGHVRVDRAACKPGQTLSGGQSVSFVVVEPVDRAPARKPLPPLKVLYEDPYLAVIDKQAGVPVHPPEAGRSHDGVDIAHMAAVRFGRLPTISGDDRPGIVHRLDKDTTGVMVLPRTDEAFHFVQSQFRARTMTKEYRAICYGDPRFDSDWVERNIAVHPKRDCMMVTDEGGKEASTFWQVLERFGDLSWMRCQPKTGRTHQIRVHMASIGHALVGDRIYKRHRANDRLPAEAPDPGRQCLHAYRLVLKHPRTHEDMVFEAPLPADIQRLLNWLRSR